MRTCGIVLAAGAGTRYGSPKGLARTAHGAPWVRLAADMLRTGGCDDVLVAVGARADEVAALVPAAARTVRVEDWHEGLSATLRAALGAASVLDPDAVILTPVDTPDADPQAVGRVMAALGDDPRRGLAQATYGGRPGHPVAVGSAHLAPLAAAVSGDQGARPYLVAHGVAEVECGDLWSGEDCDRR
ncbi:NTP transferase domain-containing protein [Microbacterium sp. BWT-B31]|uniref:nucleotidyltransferase family protein n=1 Tax=Microbacterium sp. BWT-B31 TaxID=3232072 RepID=UPI0035276BF5